eukprot:Partr_v1_DN26377_c0_g1_i3_m43410 putative inositol
MPFHSFCRWPQNAVAPDTTFVKDKSSDLRTSQILKSFAIVDPKQSIYEHLILSNKLNIHAITWNMHGESPPLELTFLLDKSKLSHAQIIIIATQECERSIEKSVIYPSKQLWESALNAHLSPEFEMVKSETMAALNLSIYVPKTLHHLIGDVECGHVATGIGNVVGNKGAVSIGFSVADRASFLVINSHFAAHQYNVAERKNDYDRIRHELPLQGRFPREPDVSNRFDHVIWVGDLNYRVNGTRKMIDSLIASNLTEVLLANDQLLSEMKLGNVFAGFSEAKITFMPTYKFDTISRILRKSSITNDVQSKNSRTPSIKRPSLSHGTTRKSVSLDPFGPAEIKNAYDSSSKQRIPSWTDRILYKSHKGEIRPLLYTANMDVKMSDHKPVIGEYELDFPWSKIFEQVS